MSVKRQATTELNHENWDQEDEVDQEEGTGFKMASKEVLEKRVIRTAKRRTPATSDEAKKTVFSAFSGFNKTQKSSFDFLANLTNGSKANNNNALTTESETSSSNYTKLTTSPTTGGFSATGTSTPLTKFSFGIQKSESSLFTGATTPAFSQSMFTSKVDKVENSNPFKIQTSQNSTTDFISKPSVNLDKPVVSQGFGGVATSVFSKSLFTPKLVTSENSSPFKIESTQSAKLTTDLIFTPSTNASKPFVSQGFGGAAFSQSMLTSKPEAMSTSAPFKIQSSQSSAFKTDSVLPNANADKPVVSQVFGGNTNSPFSKSFFSSKPNMPGNLVPAVSTTTDKPVVSGFGGVATSVFSQSMFSAKLDTPGNSSPFKIQSTQSSTLTSPTANSDKFITSQGSTGVFGISPSGSNNANSFPKSGDTSISTPFKKQDNINNSVTNESYSSVNQAKHCEAKLIYFNTLENLNKSVLAWIQKHVEESPLCYLIPVFVDYEKHLKKIYGDYIKSIETNEDSDVEAPTSLNPPSESNSTKISTDTSSTSDKTGNSAVNVGGSGTSGGFSFGIKYPIRNSTHPPSVSNSTKITTDTTSTSDKPVNSTVNVNTLSPFGGNGASGGFSFGIKHSIGNSSHPPSVSNSTKITTDTTSTSDKPVNSTFNVNTLSPFGGNGASGGFSFGIKHSTGNSTQPPSESNSTKISTNTFSSPDKTGNSAVNVNTVSPLGGSGASGGFSFGIKYPTGNSTQPPSESNSTKISTNTFSSPDKTGNSAVNVNTVSPLGGSGASGGFSFGIKYPTGNSTQPPSESNSTKISTNTFSSPDKTGNSAVNVNTISPLGGSGASGGFSFGIKYPIGNSTPFTNNLPATSASSKTPFSFGTGKPFSFNSNVKKPEESVNEAVEKDDVPPKVEYTPIVEENSVFDKKCKVFVKKDGNFVDKGVGTLYIKKIEESGKYQLLVRANTTLGNVLLNFVLSSSITTQRMGKNNVMMVCIPTPDAKPPPIPILIRVKTSEEADLLLETLNKYKA